MTFRYTDPDGHQIDASPDIDWHGQPVVTIRAHRGFTTIPVRIPIDRVEELVAGIRDTARQTTSEEAQP